MSHKISFPLMGDYHVPCTYLLKNILKDDELVEPPKMTKHTCEIGEKYSPEFVCTPFKYTLGTMIEALEQGADTLVQFGGGCRYGYYHELQREIINDLGYKCEVINLISGGKMTNLKALLKRFHVKRWRCLYYLLITIFMVRHMDECDDYIRLNSCYEKKSGTLKQIKAEMLDAFSKTKGLWDLHKKYRYYKRKMKKVPLEDKQVIKVGVIGELYTLMEPLANYHLEDELIRMGCSVKRFTNVTYLLFQKKTAVKLYLRHFFIKYRMGADALDNIYHTDYLCTHGYDGIIHIKSSFCTPEIAAMPIINKVANKYNVPVIFFSMNLNSSETGMKTRLEAFYDMLEMRKK